jgi:tetratricopeptide (TPR) repeat protein/tRNA A-37 threonylcarbamoyl transferase component Bud32
MMGSSMQSDRAITERPSPGSPLDLGEAERLARAPASDERGPAVPKAGDLGYAVVRERARAALFQAPVERQRLGRYVLLGTLGQGGMGTVLEAFDRTLDRRVAVKVLHRELGERQRQRLVREAQAMAKLSHPNVVQVYEVGEAEGEIFIAMELVRGRSLGAWLQQDPRPGWRECVQAYLQAGEGLAAAHAEGLVHRDLKPSNVIMDDKGRVRVLDFGLARQVEDTEPSEHPRTDAALGLEIEDRALATPLTRTGAVLGTLAYMPLEQMRGEPTDARSDQFSFCVSLYEALYGERPFEGRSMEALISALEVGKVRPAPKATAVPEALRKALLRGLASDAGERWPSMTALLVELQRLVAPRRRAWWGLGVAGGLAAMGMGLWQYAEVGFRCEGAQAQLDGLWDEARKQEVQDAILKTELSYAPDTWARVEARLDDYVDAWAGKHTEVCEATSVRQEQSTEVMDLRMECLRDRKVALRETVVVLAAADPGRVQKAVQLVAGLPGLSRCDDVDALRAELPPPEDPDAAARVEALRERLAQVRALLAANVHAEALAEAEAVVEQAEGLAYAPLLAEALLERSRAHKKQVQYAEAERDAERAYALAAEHGHDEVEANAAVQLVWVVGHHQARHELGLQWGRTALPKSRRFEPGLQASALTSIGAVVSGQGELEDTLTYYEGALTLTEEALGPRHPDVAALLDNIGGVLHRQGKSEQALAHSRRALALFEEVLGPRHPSVALVLNNVGAMLKEQGELEAALTHYQRALAIFEEALGPRHPNVAALLDNIGTLRLAQGAPEEALSYSRRALAIVEETLGPRHPNAANMLNNIGNVLRREGQLEDALAHFQRALAILEETSGPRHPSVAASLHNIGTVLEDQGKLAEAQTHYQRALASYEEALGPRHPDVAHSLVGLADVALVQHEPEAAREHAERAVAIREASETSPDLLAAARFTLARALWADQAQHERARALAQQARDGYAAAGDGVQQDLAEVTQWLVEHPAR